VDNRELTGQPVSRVRTRLKCCKLFTNPSVELIRSALDWSDSVPHGDGRVYFTDAPRHQAGGWRAVCGRHRLAAARQHPLQCIAERLYQQNEGLKAYSHTAHIDAVVCRSTPNLNTRGTCLKLRSWQQKSNSTGVF
jgi:hypothetical protein